jgi:hypothetical protein
MAALHVFLWQLKKKLQFEQWAVYFVFCTLAEVGF